jgi:hypothetical protein
MAIPPDPRPIEWVSSEIIRHRFNDSHLYEQAEAGDIVTDVKRASHPDTPPTGEPVCTYSQIVFYFSIDGEALAIVHQYLRPDGAIGASGRPDPKRLFLKDQILSVRSEPEPPPEGGNEPDLGT